MRVQGLALTLCVLIAEGTLLYRGLRGGFAKFYPLFYTYLIYDFTTTAGVFAIYWLWPSLHASAYWLCFVLSIVVEFAVLVEISDHIFQPYLAIRSLGRALAIAISGLLAVIYVFPAIFPPNQMRKALLDFALRTSLTKAVLLAVLFLVIRHFKIKLGRNSAGLFLGFSIYLAVNIANFPMEKRFGDHYAHVLWVASPAAYLVCVVVWTLALWKVMPLVVASSTGRTREEQSEQAALGLVRFNNTLSRFLHK